MEGRSCGTIARKERREIERVDDRNKWHGIAEIRKDGEGSGGAFDCCEDERFLYIEYVRGRQGRMRKDVFQRIADLQRWQILKEF